MFPNVAEIVPEQEKGIAKIKHFTIEKPSVRMLMRPTEYITPGTYAQLFVDGILLMSDTDMERNSNYEVIRKANGQVLIVGLGIGMVLRPLLEKDLVCHITVIEKYQDVIDLVAPYYESDKITYICADIFDWKPEKDQKFDTIYFDIWGDYSTDILDEINKLHRRGSRWLNRDNSKKWMSSWQVDRLRYEREKEKRYSYWGR